jgi:hypothetical protein
VTFNNNVYRTTIGSCSSAKIWWFILPLLSPVQLQTTLLDSDTSEVRCESALADSDVLTWGVASCTFYLRALFRYHNDPGRFCILRRFKLKWLLWRTDPLLGNGSVNTFPLEPTRATIGRPLRGNGTVNTPDQQQMLFLRGSWRGFILNRVGAWKAVECADVEC